MIQKIRGTIDILPEEIPYYRFIENTARKVAEKYGFSEIRTPTFEATELFRRGVGNTTDVVQKEMYTFLDNDNRSITLRPEGTASVARALIEHGRCGDAMPIKLYYLINCFRYEAPQAGRSREFFQFGVEMFGAGNPAADATIISLGSSVIRELGIPNIALHINSIGCPACRPAYRDALVKYFSEYRNQLCESCKGRLKTNPLRLLDCKNESCAALAAGAPKILDYLCIECSDHFSKLQSYLDSMSVSYQINPAIVRGLDYYTRTVFEFIADGIGAQSTVCGGGRYDGLIAELGGPQLAGIGFAMGITRLILAIKQAGIKIPEEPKPLLYIASLGSAATQRALSIVEGLRGRGIYAECDLVGRSLKAQMKYADKIGAAYTLILGDNEIESGKAQLRSMSSSTQEEIPIDEIEKHLLG
ncbi:MAG: histidine--tRNA ligase [Clostridiales bacterium]|nr:histidine--tRNA ligase [Clostridiales bacterium]